jgi:cobalt-zinc-cadmium efflux system protein
MADMADYAQRFRRSHRDGQRASRAGVEAPISVSGRTKGGAVALVLACVVAEAVSGWFGHSLALLSDAAHNLTDAAALGLSGYALGIARKPSHHRMTYGYHRVAVIAALAKAASLAVTALWIVWTAIGRLRSPEPASGPLMIGVALAAVAVNVMISLRLHEGTRDAMNVRNAYLHMIGDAVFPLGVALAGVTVAVTHSPVPDRIVSVLIAALILWSSYGVLRHTATVLLEGTPPGTDMPAVVATIKAVSSVLDVHDLHVWMVGPGVVACSCHVVVAEQSIRDGQQVVRSVVQDIARRFHITHTTVQMEVDGCQQSDLYCARPQSHHRTVR